MNTPVLERPKPAFASFLNKLLEIKPNTDNSWYNRGNELFKSGRLEEALASCDKALEFNPDDNAIWYNRGVILLNLGRLEKAIDSYDKALKLKPDDDAAWYNRGVALLDLGRLKEAIASYDNALKFKPDRYEAWNNRGVALFNLRRLEDAIDSYDKAIESQSDYDIAWYSRGIALAELGRWEEAIASYDNARKLNPNLDEAWNGRGIALVELGRWEEAIASYDNARNLNPNNYRVWHNRGYVLEELGHLEDAIASYNKALTIEPNLLPTLNNQGIALSNLRRYEEAIASFEKVLKIQPHNYYVWNNKGVVLLKLRRLDEALTSFNEALEFKPDNTDAFYNKALCYALQGDVEQAIENLQQAINLSPEKYREMAKTDSDFDSIREDEWFQVLIQEESEGEEEKIDAEEAILVSPLPQSQGKIQVKHLGIDQLEEGETKIFHNVSWEEFENILAELGDNRSSRLAYDQGTLEITMPSQKHEYYKEIIRDLIKYLAEELDLDCESLGSTTWKRKDLLKGAEPDNCFYIQNEPAIRNVKPNIDLSKDPPPDLILEVDYTSPSLDRQPIYAGLGVPEIWIYNMKVIRIFQLEAGKYKETDTSLAFGEFPIKSIPDFIKKNIKASPRELKASFRAWVKQYIVESE